MKLSNLELDVMRLIWRDKKVIVPELHAEIEKERDISYATVKTIVNRLEEKGAIERVRCYGRTILYGPLIKEGDLARPIVKDVLRRLFAGQVRPMISHLLKVETLSVEDLEYLESQIAEKLGKCESGGNANDGLAAGQYGIGAPGFAVPWTESRCAAPFALPCLCHGLVRLAVALAPACRIDCGVDAGFGHAADAHRDSAIDRVAGGYCPD